MGTMYFGTWVDHEGEYFDTAHFTDSLKNIPFRAVDVTCFLEPLESIIIPTVTVSKWPRCPSCPIRVILIQTTDNKSASAN
jgi:DNA polymerase-3 subunit alpha/error-prone DNA polymerase